MSESDPLLQRLADANPVPLQEVDGEGRSTSADDLLVRILDRDPTSFGLGRGPKRKRRIAAASVLLVSLTAGTVILRASGDAPASASELLLRTAAIAAVRETSTHEGEYIYSRVETDQLVTGGGTRGWSADLPVVEERWVSSDGSGRIRSNVGALIFFGPRDGDRWQSSGAPEFASGVSDNAFAAGTLPYEDPRLLPTPPASLERVLRQSVSSQDLPADVALFRRVGELLARGDAPPDLRAALYRIASQLAGVEVIGDTIDPVGRPGVAVAMTYSEGGAAVQVVMIFDAQTSVLLAEERILLERASWVDAPPGTRLSFVAYLEASWTESVQETPASSVGGAEGAV